MYPTKTIAKVEAVCRRLSQRGYKMRFISDHGRAGIELLKPNGDLLRKFGHNKQVILKTLCQSVAPTQSAFDSL